MKIMLLTRTTTENTSDCLPNWCPPTGECMPKKVCAPDHWCPPNSSCHPDCSPNTCEIDTMNLLISSCSPEVCSPEMDGPDWCSPDCSPWCSPSE